MGCTPKSTSMRCVVCFIGAGPGGEEQGDPGLLQTIMPPCTLLPRTVCPVLSPGHTGHLNSANAGDDAQESNQQTGLANGVYLKQAYTCVMRLKGRGAEGRW